MYTINIRGKIVVSEYKKNSILKLQIKINNNGSILFETDEFLHEYDQKHPDICLFQFSLYTLVLRCLQMAE